MNREPIIPMTLREKLEQTDEGLTERAEHPPLYRAEHTREGLIIPMAWRR